MYCLPQMAVIKSIIRVSHMKNNYKLYHELLEIIEGQNLVIERQNELIANLVNENLEKENYINVLAKELELEFQ